MQFATPLPASVPLCQPGHRPQLVEHRGAPLGHAHGAPCPPLLHIECHRCGLATVPSESRAIAELRWTDPTLAGQLIPLSRLSQARHRVLSAIPRAA